MKLLHAALTLSLLGVCLSASASESGLETTDERVFVDGPIFTYIAEVNVQTKTRDIQLGKEIFRSDDGTCYQRTTELLELEQHAIHGYNIELPRIAMVTTTLPSCEAIETPPLEGRL